MMRVTVMDSWVAVKAIESPRDIRAMKLIKCISAVEAIATIGATGASTGSRMLRADVPNTIRATEPLTAIGSICYQNYGANALRCSYGPHGYDGS